MKAWSGFPLVSWISQRSLDEVFTFLKEVWMKYYARQRFNKQLSHVIDRRHHHRGSTLTAQVRRKNESCRVRLSTENFLILTRQPVLSFYDNVSQSTKPFAGATVVTPLCHRFCAAANATVLQSTRARKKERCKILAKSFDVQN